MATLANIFGIGFCLIGLFGLFEPGIFWEYSKRYYRSQGIKDPEPMDDYFSTHPRAIAVFLIGFGALILFLYSL